MIWWLPATLESKKFLIWHYIAGKKNDTLCASLLSICRWQVALLHIALERAITPVSTQLYADRALESE